MGSFIMGVDQDKKDEGKLAKTTRDRSVSLYFIASIYIITFGSQLSNFYIVLYALRKTKWFLL